MMNQLVAQKLKIITSKKLEVEVVIIDSAKISNLLSTYLGRKDDSKFKDWTSKTYVLNDNRMIIEFFDRQGVLVKNESDFNKLKEVRFVKNQIWNLKKNISYKIQLTYEQGLKILETEKPKRLSQFKSDLPEHSNFDVFELKNNQILFLDDSGNQKSAGIYPDIKTLVSENTTIAEEYYSSNDEEDVMKKLASGDALTDYEPNEHFIDPKYIDELIKNHQLQLIEQNIYIKQFYGNLYQSKTSDLYFLIDEINQKNGTGDKMQIVEVSIFKNLSEIRNAQQQYEKLKNSDQGSEYFYQKISDQYGKDFTKYIPNLIDQIPQILNIEKGQLTLDTKGLEVLDEAIIWNHENTELFDKWFPSVVAFYGEYYIKNIKKGKWLTKFDTESNLWIPQIQLNDETFAWDAGQFYKDLYEGGTRLVWLEELK